MLVRLLVAVLTLVGPVPLSACTCAAGQSGHSSALRGSPTTHATQSCRCAHYGSPDAASTHKVVDSGAGCEEPGQPVQHERDCPAVSPGSVVRQAVPQPTTEVPIDNGTACAGVFWVPSLGTAAALSPSERPAAPKNPLYLTLLSLRN
jgi:hypothetical protein